METYFHDITRLYPFLILLALVNVGLHTIAAKFKIIDAYAYYRQRWMPDVCEFCLFFWMAFIELWVINNDYNNFILTLGFNFGMAVAMAVISRKFL